MSPTSFFCSVVWSSPFCLCSFSLLLSFPLLTLSLSIAFPFVSSLFIHQSRSALLCAFVALWQWLCANVRDLFAILFSLAFNCLSLCCLSCVSGLRLLSLPFCSLLCSPPYRGLFSRLVGAVLLPSPTSPPEPSFWFSVLALRSPFHLSPRLSLSLSLSFPAGFQL